MKRTIVFALAALAATALTGCKKPTGPKTTEIEAVDRRADDLMPVPARAETPATDTVVIEHPALTPPPTAEPPQEKTHKLHTVAKGETLMSIARKHYGNAARYKDIAKFNNIDDPDKIFIGQVLKIPD